MHTYMACPPRMGHPHHSRGGHFGPPPWMMHMGPPQGRRVPKGSVKTLILDALKDQPRHGYEIIQAIEESSNGAYRPSPGTVYPTLQMLEEMELVEAESANGKKVYALTDAGREELAERRDEVEDAYDRFADEHDWAENDEFLGLFESFPKLFQVVRRAYRRGRLDDAKLAAIKKTLDDASAKIEAIAKGKDAATD
jgi:DNA-binding PadR family transcriptional regulator